MVEKVEAEGTIWRIPGSENAAPQVLAENLSATKVALVTGDVWKLYFPVGMTPTEDEAGRRLNTEARPLLMVAPMSIVRVTPMWQDSDLTGSENDAMIEIQPSEGDTK